MRCALLIFVLATNLSDQAAATVTEGENYNDFSVLCGLVSFAQTTVDDRKAGTDIQTILKQLSAINLTIGDDNIRKAIKAQNKKKWANLGAPEQNQLGGYKDNWDLWTEAMEHSETEATAAALKEWEKHRNNEAVKKQIQHLTETAVAAAKQTNGERPKLLATAITTHLNKALYGGSGQATDLKGTSSTRANICGKGNDSNGGEDAGKALLLDVLCMCAYDSTDTNAGKACYKGCENSPNNAAWTTNQDSSNRAAFLVSKCPANMKPQAPSRAELAARLAAFDRAVHNAKGTSYAEKFVLGVVGGTGAAGCTGEHATGTNNLKQLAATLDSRANKHSANQNKAAELKRAAAQAVQIAKEAKSLTISAINTKKAAADEEATAVSNRACENHTTNATCRTDNNCKWTSTDKSNGDFCKPKEEEGQTNAGTGTGVRAAGTTTKKFNGKLETDCDKALG
uniref:Variant surface glycoprotein 1223 n=1 Tax=Trypanosoma brucei TaxID=5691 RepID=M4SXZ1_9TRYP|nr:variant surface glycoprotein 1223 [Trypanosoma brucei]